MPEKRKTARHDSVLAFFVFDIVVDVVVSIIGPIVFGL